MTNSSDIEAIKLLLGLGFGGILAVAMIILFHTGHPFYGILCFFGVFFTWLLDNKTSTPIISTVLLLSGFVEIFLKNGLGAFILIALAFAAFFIPKIVD
jgi:hypothetical protein